MRKSILSGTLATLTCLLVAGMARAEIVETDVCVYGGTAAGVTAAIQTLKMGKTVVLLEPGQHVGGLTTGGLGYTDIGNKAAIGGLSHEFYKRMGRFVNKPESWTFAPSQAEQALNDWIRETGVRVKFNERLASVNKQNARITEITMESGDVFRARVFIDTTYEGDLMAKSGVSYHVGREANAVYGETLNGIRDKTPHHQFLVPVDPYLKPGDPTSGLLPFIQPTPFGEPGAGDKSVQAYNFRLCLTKNPANKLPITPPPNYDPAQYELLGRYFDALAAAGKQINLGQLLKIDRVTPDKTDINNQGGFSTDFIGMNHNFPEADYPTREAIKAAHIHYIQGYLTYLATSPRAPEAVRKEMSEWGLCKDEFTDTAGWPRQMYVRECRRMIAAYVMSEKNCRRTEIINDPVGLAAYNMDSHNCRRIVRNGRVENEGDVQVAPMSPYSIAYRSIVPKQDQCENLCVPVCLSASHIAYGSIRMEPVFMILGQSAATAAAMAIDAQKPLQAIDYPALRTRLEADNQILEWTGKIKSDSRINP
jgi:hypothetical protein